MSRFPQQRWRIAAPQPEQADRFAHLLQLHPLLAQVLLNRSVHSPEAAQVFLNPELQILPSPLDEFEDLPIALELLLRAIASRQFIAICGDYDADGMTSTALLLRALRFLGAVVDYAIPSRMQEGYGINQRIIEEFHEEGVGLILTVDNGIAAHEPIALARKLGMSIIVTDHHDIPPTLPPANAILNPKLIREDSPYRGVAGVGVAYILAICLAQSLQKMQDLTTPLIELFTLGTIADLAPLTGVNRRWVKRGLKLLPRSRMTGIQALIQVAGLSNEKSLKPEAIGFRLGPRINAIGRLADPQIVIELLTTDDDGRALELAMKCEQVNQLRQRLCELIEQEALAWCIETQFNPQQARVLVIVQPNWHHGVIGIVASRLVERYGVPVFIGTYEEEETADSDDSQDDSQDLEDQEAASDAAETPLSRSETTLQTSDADPSSPVRADAKVRGSARGIPEFDVFAALQFCEDLLGKFGGHKAAGGFTLNASNLAAFQARLQQFAHQTLAPEHLKPLVTIDVQADFRDLTLDLYERMDALHPCGIENPDPVFWTPNIHIVEQRTIGQNQAHLKLTLAQVDDPTYSLRALAWRWGVYHPLPDRIDIAYRLRLNDWNGTQSVELELVGVRPSTTVSAEASVVAAKSASARMVSAKSIKPFPVQRLIATDPVQPAINPENAAAPAELDLEFPVDPTPADPLNDTPNQLVDGGNHARGNGRSQVDLTPIKDAKSIGVGNAEASENYEQANQPAAAIDCFECNPDSSPEASLPMSIEFYYSKRKYTGSVHRSGNFRELRINDFEGQHLIIQPERRRGFLSQGEMLQEIDVSQVHYFNLVRSAMTALELVETRQLLQEKDQQIAQLHQQVQALTQQLDQLQTLSLASPATPAPAPSLEPNLTEAVSLNQDAVVAPSKPADPKQRLQFELGDAVWQRLDSRSQKDLIAAVKKQLAIPADAASDYSDVGLRLCSVIEREVIQPFFREIHQFLLENEEPCEIGGVTLRARKKYTLGMLPPLLATAWHSFQEEALCQSEKLAAETLYTEVLAHGVEQTDRDTIQVFLSQWEHPLAVWLQSQSAASVIAQIDKLLTVAADADSPLYEWQLELLQSLILGAASSQGILQQIYGARA